MKEKSVFVVPTPRGDFFCFFTSTGITRLSFPGQKDSRLISRQTSVTCPFDRRAFTKDLNAYLSGKKITFSYPLDIAGTPFQQKVWRTMTRIPYGSVWSYREVAERGGLRGAFRAVGNACANNQVPILIPCHRVVRSDGRLGGFSAGVTWKTALLQLECVSLPLIKKR